MANDLEVVGGAIDHGRGFRSTVTAIDYQVNGTFIFLLDQLRVGRIFDDLILVVNRHGKNRVTQLTDQCSDDIVIRHTDAHLFLCLIDLRQLAACGKDKGKRPRQVLLHQLKGRVTDLGVLAEVREVIANDRKVTLLGIDPFKATDPLDRTHIERVAANGIDRVGRIDDKAALPQDLDGLVYLFQIRIFRINLDQHINRR